MGNACSRRSADADRLLLFVAECNGIVGFMRYDERTACLKAFLAQFTLYSHNISGRIPLHMVLRAYDLNEGS